jgi:hypothetical protein
VANLLSTVFAVRTDQAASGRDAAASSSSIAEASRAGAAGASLHPQSGERIMHDIDRVRLETQSEANLFESGSYETEQFELGESSSGQVLGEQEQMELASELLEVATEQELDRFIGNLVSRAGQAMGGFIRSPEAKAIGGVLKAAAKKVLPAVGADVGQYFGGDRGAAIGQNVASAVGNLFGLELEGLSNEDREFEVARRFVNYAAEAVKNLALTPAAGLPVAAAAIRAARHAAQTHAPGLATPTAPTVGAFDSAGYDPGPYGAGAQSSQQQSGRWIRRGRKIILYGV